VLSKIDKTHGNKVRIDEERQQKVDDDYQEELEKSADWLLKQHQEEAKRRGLAVSRTLDAEDHLARQQRVESRAKAAATEKTVEYEDRLKKIEQIQADRRRRFEEAEMSRRQLEAEQARLLEDSFKTGGIGDYRQLRDMAADLEIDWARIRSKATEKLTRGKTLPPIQPPNEQGV
jgi:hypothetical protein